MLKRWVPWWALGLVVVMAVGTVWLRLAIVRTTYSINQTERAIRELRQAREQMQLKVTALKSPRRLEVLARSRFNVGTPRSNQVVYMRASGPAVEGTVNANEAKDPRDARDPRDPMDAVAAHQAAPERGAAAENDAEAAAHKAATEQKPAKPAKPAHKAAHRPKPQQHHKPASRGTHAHH